MRNIQILASGKYLPITQIENNTLEEKFQLEPEYIYKRTGIKKRYKTEENIEQIAIKAVQNLLQKSNFDSHKIECIIVATTTTNKLMPGISYLIQKELQIPTCMCLDVLAGCSGYINAFDIARNYIALEKVKYALVVGVEKLSDFVDEQDLSTAILFSDGAGATLLGSTQKEKQYECLLESNGNLSEILTCASQEKLYMDGKAIYKYAVTDTVTNIQSILKQSDETLEHISYIIPHQSNSKIIKQIGNRLQLEQNKIYCNLENVGNTFCASIPIALDEILEHNQLKENDKIILLGYGGGLNLGSILMEV